jgi:nucleoside-diphosphate-sugar epimerase
MLRDERVLVTGPAGQIAFPLVTELAKHNEVWGIARFGDPATRAKVDAVGVTTRAVDLADPDWSVLPSHFDHVLHFAVFQSLDGDYDYSMRVNAEGTGLLLQRFRDATSVLVVSTVAVYDINPDPLHAFREDDPLGDSKQPYSPPYPVTKIAQEGVARTMARALDLPTTIARMDVSYGPNGGLPAYQLDWIMADEEVPLLEGGTWFSPIEQTDINAQVPKLLDVASVPATILNWAGDDAVKSEDWLEYLGSLVGKTSKLSYHSVGITSRVCDNTRRRELIGDCRVPWQDGFRAMVAARYPGALVG